MLTKKQLKHLRKQITINSLFLKDYDNDLYIKPKDVCAFFDSVIDYYEDDISDLRDLNIDMIYNYYIFFEDDPLPQRDYIAVKPLNNFGGIGVLEILYDQYIIYRHDYGDHNLQKIQRHRLYLNDRGYYFIDRNKRYYLDDFAGVY